MDTWSGSLGSGTIRWIAILPLLSAVIHGLLIGLVRARISQRTIWSTSLATLSASFLLTAFSFFELLERAPGGRMLDAIGPWIGGGVGARSFSAELSLQLDPLSGVFCLAVTGVALAVYVCSVGLVRSGRLDAGASHRLFAMLDLLVGSTLVAVLADNFLLFFLGWAGIGIASQLFAAFSFDQGPTARAGAVTFVIGRIGDLGLLGATLLLFDGLARAGAPALTFRGIEAAFRLLEGQGVALLARDGAASPLLLEIVGAGLVVAALTKCAQLPLHVWLPGASSGAPLPAMTLMHSATTVLVGVYVLLRFSFLLESAPTAMATLAGLGAATLLLASLAAATQLDLLRLLAFTTSAQLGLVLLQVGVGAPSGAAFGLLTHAFVKAHLVLAFGLVVRTLGGETDLRRMGGLGYRMRWTQGMVALGALATVGVPPLAGFFATEEAIAFVAVSPGAHRPALVAVVLVAQGLLAFALARAFFLVFWGNVRPGGRVEARLQDPTGWMQHGLTALAVMSVAAGGLTPSQFWGDLWGIDASDSVGLFLDASLAGAVDPGLEGSERMRLIGALLACVGIGGGLAAWRYARRGYRGEVRQRSLRVAVAAVREMLLLDRLYDVVLVRPLRLASSWALERGIEGGLIDRLLVSGGADLGRRMVWSGLRRLQNGRLQSYALLGVLTALVIVTWMVR